MGRLGREAEGKRVVGLFEFFFYFELCFPFSFILFFGFKFKHATNSNLNIPNICIKQKVKSRLSMMQHFMSPLGFTLLEY